MGNYASGYGPRQKADRVGSVLSMVSLQNVFSNSGAVKLGRSGYCICANLRFFWDAFKMGRILEKWHISNTKASSWARSYLSPARHRGPSSSEDSVAQRFFFIAKYHLPHFWKELNCFLELKTKKDIKPKILFYAKFLLWKSPVEMLKVSKFSSIRKHCQKSPLSALIIRFSMLLVGLLGVVFFFLLMNVQLAILDHAPWKIRKQSMLPNRHGNFVPVC